MTPEQVIEARGLRKDWVAKQMGISAAYLSRMLSGDRRWTEPLQERFAVAVGMDRSAIFFPQSGTSDAPAAAADSAAAS